MSQTLQSLFGPIDIYLFDQLLRSRITPGMRIFDAGCGSGRNLHFLLQNGFDVCGVDSNPLAIETVRELVAHLAPHLPFDNFRAEPLEHHSFESNSVDVVISSAVLHFANDEKHFRAMLDASWRPLKRGGVFFCRLASSIGMEDRMQHIANCRYRLPDGSERFLVDEAMLMSLTRLLGASLIDPIKTTVVQDQRCMTTWVLRRE